MCQFQSSASLSCGKVTDVTWIVQREFPYVFTVAYSGGDSCHSNVAQQRYDHMLLLTSSNCNLS